MKFGCCTGLDDLPNVLPSGFDFAELQVRETVPLAPQGEWEATRKKIQDYGVPILGFNVLLPGGMKIVGNEVDEDALNAYVSGAFARMSELGGRHLSFGSGTARSIPSGFDRSRAIEQLQTFVSYLGQLGKEHGITVNIEFLNRKETNIITSLVEAEEYVKATSHENVKLLADLYHIMEENEPLEDMYQVGHDIGYVHVADTNRRFPGSGSYPFELMATILREINYAGLISVECNWEDMNAQMPQAAMYLRQVFS